MIWICLGVALLFGASIVGMEDVDERRKNYRAGTHDYYGNKIENNNH